MLLSLDSILWSQIELKLSCDGTLISAASLACLPVTERAMLPPWLSRTVRSIWEAWMAIRLCTSHRNTAQLPNSLKLCHCTRGFFRWRGVQSTCQTSGCCLDVLFSYKHPEAQTAKSIQNSFIAFAPVPAIRKMRFQQSREHDLCWDFRKQEFWTSQLKASW